MTRKLMSSLLILLSFGSVAKADAGIKPSILQFKDDIEEHRQEVYLAGFRLVRGRPELFPVLNSFQREIGNLLMASYFSRHDRPKTMTMAELRELGYEGDTSILVALHEVYHKILDPNSPIIKTLNQIEDRDKAKAMASALKYIDPSSHESIMKELKMAEWVADIVHTKIFRGVELNFIPNPFGAEKWFRDRGLHAEADLARWYESTFHKDWFGRTCRATHR